ncbi:hypothetical protein [Amycolatopsis nigrescens]|uniref:hypothetical protein n=1 Tax=Amycolatopsis nigrescens TaxID=381445 RepID=UPI00038285CD|nr:hypothetical protein [Amycolatopsis nigrescens]
MSTEAKSVNADDTDDTGDNGSAGSVGSAITQPPTTPCTVVWCQGHPFVLESGPGKSRWVGIGPHGKPQALTGADLQRRGWSYRRVS